MNRRTLGIIFMALMILGIAIPFTTLNTITYATITGRPVIYYNNQTNITLTIPADAKISLYLGNVSISGAWIWIWFSQDGSAAIVPEDAWYIGPINVYNIISAGSSTIYVNVSRTFAPYVGSKLIVEAGNQWLNFTLPKVFEYNKNITYWIKITDVNPELRPNIPSSDVAVSVNNFTVTPVFDLSTANGGTNIVPNEPITVYAYATDVGVEYNITYNTTAAASTLIATVESKVNTIPAQDYNPEWNWTGIEYTFQAPDLGLTPGDSATAIEININQTGTIIKNWTLTELAREVTLYNSTGPITIPSNTIPSYNITQQFNLTVEYFRYNGSLTITLSNLSGYLIATLANNVPLDEWGRPITPTDHNITLTIPASIPRSGYYWLNITDGSTTVSIKIYIKIVPRISITPSKGHVGDVVTVNLTRFDDYLHQVIRLQFEDGSVLRTINGTANITVTAPNMTVQVIIPNATYGLHTVYAINATNNNNTVIATTSFFVEAKVWVEPSVITEGQKFLTIVATGLNDTGYYDIMLDQGTLLWGFEAGPHGVLTVTVPATGLKPGLHVVAVYYEYWATPNVTTPQLYATFTVSGPTLEDILNAVNGLSSQLNDVVVGINDLKALITSLGDDITLKLQSINNTLATLIIEKNNEVIAKLCTKLNELNATIVSIKGDTVELKTAVGNIQTTLQALKSSNAELKDLIITKSGEIKGVIQTAAGNITANLNALEQLIKSGLKVDTQTLLSKIDEIKGQLGSISGSVSSVSSKLDQLASTLDDLKSMLSNVQSTVSNVQSTVTDIKSSLQDIKSTASNLASKIESTASSIKSYISSQNSDLKKAVEGISGTVSTYGIISIILIIIAIAVSGYGVYKKKE